MDKQQIKQILDNAPEGATHYDSDLDYYFRNKTDWKWHLWNDEDKKYYLTSGSPNRALSDLRTQLALIEENEKLKAALEAVANWQNADKDQVEHCVNVLKELSNDN